MYFLRPGKSLYLGWRLFLAGAVIAVSMTFPLPSHAQVRENPEDILLFGFKAYQDGFYDPAADALGKFLRLRPGSARAATVRYLYAEALRRSERSEEAIVAYRKFLGRHGKDRRASEVRFRLAELLEKLGDRVGAIKNYLSVGKGELRAEAVYRSAEYYLKDKKWMEASSALMEFLSLAPKDARVESALYERAKALDHLKQYEKAASAYETATKRFPKSSRSLAAKRRLGFIQIRLKRYSDAENSIKIYLRMAPREIWKPDIKLALASSYFGQKKYSQAAKTFEGALSLKLSEKQKESVRRGVADSWWNAGNFQRAAVAYRQVMENSSHPGKILLRYLHSLNRSDACRPNGKESLAYALDVMKGGVKLEPRNQLLLANCLQKAGMEAEAGKNFEAVIRSSPGQPLGIAAGLRVAELSDASGRREEAAARFENLLKAVGRLKDPGKFRDKELLNGVYLGVLRAADFRFQSKDCGSAVGLIKAVPRGSIPAKARAEVASLLGECAFRNGNLDEAELQFGRILVGGRRPVLAARARVRLAAIANARGDKKESLRRLREALPLLPEPMHREARLEAGRLLREMGKIREAREMLLFFAKDNKADAQRRQSVWMILAQDAAASGKWNEAERALKNWNALDPPDPREGMRLWTTVLYRSGKCPQAIETANKALAGGKDHPAREELLRITVSCLLEGQKYAEAPAVLKKIAALSPEDAEVALQLGNLYERNGKPKEAAREYEAFIRKFPNHTSASEVALRLGFLEAGEGKRESALNAYRIAVGSPRLKIAEPARYNLALDMEERGKVEEALAEYEKIAVRDLAASKWRRSASWRAAVLREQRGEYERAIAHYMRIARVSSSNDGAQKSLIPESRQAAARAKKLKDYLDAVRRREEKMKNRVPLLR